MHGKTQGALAEQELSKIKVVAQTLPSSLARNLPHFYRGWNFKKNHKVFVAEFPKAIRERNVSEGRGWLQIVTSSPCFPGQLCLLGLLLTCVGLTSHLGPIFSPLT